MAGYFVSSSDFDKFVIKLLNDAEVFAPVISEGRPRLKKITPASIPSINLGSYRTAEPVKSMFLKAKEDVSRYFNDNGNNAYNNAKKIVFCKSCDIAALIFEDKFFSIEINDPFYTGVRDNTIIIGTDCGDAIPTCHCNIVGVKPYPEKYFDLNMSVIRGGYLVDVGSEKGRELVDSNRLFFIDAVSGQRDEQSRIREIISNKVEEFNRKYQYKTPLEKLAKNGLESEIWRTIARSCTECGACNMVCPTCTCFLLYDERKGRGFVRSKEWDSCMKAGYARAAGGANTRPLLYRRTQNRWQCKFDYMFDKYDVYACSGCGRCSEVCMAKIDLREAFLELEKQAVLGLKLE